MRTDNKVIFKNVAMTGNHQSSAIPLLSIFGYAIQLEFTGSPVGSFSVFVSCDPAYYGQATGPQPSNWTLLANSTQAISAAGNILYNVNEVNYNWVYVAYTFGSGSGTLNGTINLKGF